MYTATIVRDLSNRHERNVYHIRISENNEPDIGGNVELVEILRHEREDLIKVLATQFVKSLPTYASTDD